MTAVLPTIANPEPRGHKQLKTTLLQGSHQWSYIQWFPVVSTRLWKRKPCLCKGGFSARRWVWVSLAHVQIPGSHTNSHHSDGHCEHPKNSCAQPQSLLGHCYSKYLPPNKTTWSSDAQVLNPLECLECVRCEAAGSRKNASFRDQKYVARSHCTATDHLWDLRLTNSCLLWLCPSQLSGANCLPLGLPWGGNGNIYKRPSTVPVRQYLLDE